MIAVMRASIALIIAAFGYLGWFIARRLTEPVQPRRFELTIRGVEAQDATSRVILDRTEQTSTRGIYNLWCEGGAWVALTPEVEHRGAVLIARTATCTQLDALPRTGERASWSGIYYSTPTDAGLDPENIVIDTPPGAAPAWLFRGDRATWAIHIHGLGSSRAGTLRGVVTTSRLGYTSLSVTFRNGREGPPTGNRRSTLGVTEVNDVEEAIGYAVRHGAQRLILFGWSMGGAIALQLADRSPHRHLIAGLVLDSPVLDWVEVIKANCSRSNVPSLLGGCAIPWLTIRPLARIIGLPTTVPLRSFDWIERANDLAVPVLILHGTGDSFVPLRLSQELEARRSSLVEVVSFEAGHTLAWNSDPSRWHRVVADWLTRQIAQPNPSG